MARTVIKLNQAIKRAQYILDRHPGYSMENRGTHLDAPMFDCSSFVGTVWDVWDAPGHRPATPNMAAAYRAAGFDVYTYGDTRSYGRLKKGDILVHNGAQGGAGADGHTAMIWIDGGIIESTGGIGVHTTRFYEYNWQIVIRGQGGIEIVKWTGQNPWSMPGY